MKNYNKARINFNKIGIYVHLQYVLYMKRAKEAEKQKDKQKEKEMIVCIIYFIFSRI